MIAQPKEEICQLSLTLLLAMSFTQTQDVLTFAGIMTEKQNFDLFQLAFLLNCKVKQSSLLSDFVIILQKLSQQEPQGVLACMTDESLSFLNSIVASSHKVQNTMDQQFLVSNIKSILKNINE